MRASLISFVVATASIPAIHAAATDLVAKAIKQDCVNDQVACGDTKCFNPMVGEQCCDGTHICAADLACSHEGVVCDPIPRMDDQCLAPNIAIVAPYSQHLAISNHTIVEPTGLGPVTSITIYQTSTSTVFVSRGTRTSTTHLGSSPSTTLQHNNTNAQSTSASSAIIVVPQSSSNSTMIASVNSTILSTIPIDHTTSSSVYGPSITAAAPYATHSHLTITETVVVSLCGAGDTVVSIFTGNATNVVVSNNSSEANRLSASSTGTVDSMLSWSNTSSTHMVSITASGTGTPILTFEASPSSTTVVTALSYTTTNSTSAHRAATSVSMFEANSSLATDHTVPSTVPLVLYTSGAGMVAPKITYSDYSLGGKVLFGVLSVHCIIQFVITLGY